MKSAAAQSRTARFSGLRILVVEDELLLAMALDDALTALGCIVSKTPRVSEALRLAATEAIDGAILDVNIAGQESYPLAHELARRGIPFVFVTGYEASRLPSEHRGRPMLRKPFRPADLERVMAAALAASSPPRP